MPRRPWWLRAPMAPPPRLLAVLCLLLALALGAEAQVSCTSYQVRCLLKGAWDCLRVCPG